MVEETFLTKVKFTKLVEQTVSQLRVSYFEAILHLGETHGIEMEDMKKYISPIIKDRLEAEARDLNLLPRENKLPIGD